MTNLLESFDVDIEEILKDLREEWLEQEDSRYNPNAFTKIKHSGENIMFCCPFHSEKRPSCGIRKESPYVWNCFTCGESGDLYKLISRAIGSYSEMEGIKYILNNYISISKGRKPLDIDAILDKGGDSKKRENSTTEEEILKFKKKRHSYIVGRGFNHRTLWKYEVGYDEETCTITYPVRDSLGNPRFIARRSVNNKSFLNQRGVYKKDIIYGLYYLIRSHKKIDRIYLNESATDTWSCYQAGLPAGAVLGRILFKEQVEELKKAGIQVVNLFFDNDKYGFKATVQSYDMLSKYSAIKVNVVIYPGNHWGLDTVDDSEILYKDANDLLRAKMLDHIELIPYEEFIIRLGGEKLYGL